MATYSGDTDYGPATAALTQSVGKAATSTALVSPASSVGVGAPVTYFANVSPVPDGGTMAFSDNGTTIAGCASVRLGATGGTATCQVSYSTTGAHSVVATYSGDANFAGSASPVSHQSVGEIATTTSLVSSSASVPTGTAVSYFANVSPVPGGGTVAFTDGTAVVAGCGAVEVNASSGTATCQTGYSAPGPHSIVATYSGDDSYATSSSGPLTETVGMAATTTTLSASSTSVGAGGSVKLFASVNPVPDGGTVSFTDGTSTVSGCGAVAVSTSTGLATCRARFSTLGARSLVATFSGDGAYGASASATVSETVVQGATATALNSSAGTASVGQSVTFTSVTSPVPDGGTVAFAANGAPVPGCGAVAASTSTGVATCQTSFTSLGTEAVAATYSGNADYAASGPAGYTETVGASSTATLLAASSDAEGPVNYVATVSPVPEGGTVSFAANGTTISACGSVSVDSTTGMATCPTTYSGPSEIVATYSGDDNYEASSSASLSLAGGAASTGTTSTALTSTAQTVSVGQVVSYLAIVGPVPDGASVAFTDNGTTISGCGSVSANTTSGTASCQSTYSSPGTHAIVATYAGDAQYWASASPALSETVAPSATSTVLGPLSGPQVVGQSVTYTASISPVPDGGTVDFNDPGTPVPGCGAVPVGPATGIAVCQATYSAPVTDGIVATYSGDDDYQGSSSVTLSEAVGTGPTSVVLNSSSGSVAPGTAVYYFATTSPVPDGGTVAFTDNATPISGCGPVNVNTTSGTATCRITYTGPGTHGIVATYSGDDNYLTSSSAPFSQTVGSSFTTTVLRSSGPSTATSLSVTFSATVSPVPDAGPVSFAENGTTIYGCGSVSIDATSGMATCRTKFALAGTFSIVATYSGDSGYATSSSTALDESVYQPGVSPGGPSATPTRGASSPSTSSTLAASAGPVVMGATVVYFAKVAPVPKGGTVHFIDGATTISGCAAVPIDSFSGVATCRARYPHPGTHSIIAIYSGGSAYATSSATLTEVVLSTPAAPSAIVVINATSSAVTVSFDGARPTVLPAEEVGTSYTVNTGTCSVRLASAAKQIFSGKIAVRPGELAVVEVLRSQGVLATRLIEANQGQRVLMSLVPADLSVAVGTTGPRTLCGGAFEWVPAPATSVTVGRRRLTLSTTAQLTVLAQHHHQILATTLS